MVAGVAAVDAVAGAVVDAAAGVAAGVGVEPDLMDGGLLRGQTQ